MLKKPQNFQFDDETIQSLFGVDDAESESIERLREYYIKNDTYLRMNANLPIRVLVGHKGIGKSALFKVSIAEEKEKENLPILIKPDDIAELGKNDENFLLKIRQWKIGLIKIIGAKVFSELGVTDETIIGKLSQFGVKLVSFISESITSFKTKVNLEPTQTIAIDNFLKKKKIIVYIDDLDRGWEGRKDDIIRLSALLNSVRDLANENPGIIFKISLRSDVYFLVRTGDESTDKIDGNVIWYSWTNHEILVMLVKRVLTYFGEPTSESALINSSQGKLANYLDIIMETRFKGEGKWEDIAVHRMLMSLIRKRPRDIVKLCSMAARAAYRDKSQVIQTKHFQSIFEEYSQGRIQDTINEYRSELSNIESLIFGMKPNKREKEFADSFVFSASQLQTKLNNIITQNRFVFSNGKPAKDKDLSHFLFKINFLTARKRLDNGDIDRKYFEENRYISSPYTNFGYDWEIHPAYRWALQPDSLESIFQKLLPSAD